MATHSLKSVWRSDYFIIISFLLAALMYHLFAYIGHFGYDDMHYAVIAADLNKGEMDFSDHYFYRWTIVGLTAISYFLFGVNDFASAMPAQILFVLTILLVYRFIGKENTTWLIIAISLTAFCPPFLFYSDKLMPDIYVAFFVLLAFYFYTKVRFGKFSNSRLASLYFTLALLFAFLSKETVILILPLLLFYFATDIWHKRSIAFWKYNLLWLLVLGAAYLTFTYLITGNGLSRFDALKRNEYLSLCSYGDQPISMLLERLSIGLFALMIKSGLIIPLAIILALILEKGRKVVLSTGSVSAFYITTSCILLLSSNFMTISLNDYSPMCLDIRHYLFIIPILAITVGQVGKQFPTGIIHNKTSVIVFLLAILLCILNASLPQILTSIAVFILVALRAIGISRFSDKVYTLCFAAILLLSNYEMFDYASKVRYRARRNFVKESIIVKFQDAYIVTDDIQRRLGNYYKAFSDEKGPLFLGLDERDKLEDIRPVFLLINGHTIGMSQEVLPAKAYLASLTTPVLSDKSTDITLYNFSQSYPNRTLLESQNDFEDSAMHWSGSITSRNVQPSSGSSACNVVNEFSSTLTFQFREDSSALCKAYEVKGTFNCLQKNVGKAQLVLVLENDNKVYHRQEQFFTQYIKSIDKWWPTEFQFVIPPSVLLSDTKLSLYVWNHEKTELFLDDFEVRILEYDLNDLYCK